MNIMELGAIGELVGGVAVIGSLIYVGFQVRQSNAHAKQSLGMERSQANREMSRYWADIVAATRDPDFVATFQRATVDFDGLSRIDKGRIGFWLGSLQVHGVASLLAGRSGMMDEDYVDRWLDFFAAIVKCPGLRPFWESSKGYYYAEFVAAVDERLQPAKGLPDLLETFPWLEPEPMDEKA